HIVAIELLAAAQGIDLRRPLKTSPRLQEAMAALRARVAFLDRDRPMGPDIGAIQDLVASGWFTDALAGVEDSPLFDQINLWT
ncbi:MAG: hypothetical protein ACE5KF_11650, partial [Kiloniellaceae bacterium]